ncbi:MAG: divalent-cation tolerance protein CutA [Nanoarchaeota archaeon]
MKYTVYITCKNKKEADKIALSLVKERLAACVNMFPINSIYRWKRKIVRDREIVLLAKTSSGKANRLIKRVKEMHSYSVPCITFWEIKKGNETYLRWIEKETK